MLAVDIGGSSVKAGLVTRVDGRWKISARFEPLVVPTRTYAALNPMVRQAVARALDLVGDLNVVGISTTGSADRKNVVLGSGFFEGYQDVSWKSVFDEAFPDRSWKVRVVNDGRAAAWGTYLEDEHARGLSLAHFVVGTGIGGGVVIDGRLVHGAHNFAGVLGHLRVSDEETERCVCRRYGCVELFAATPAVLRTAAALGLGADGDSIGALAASARAGSLDAKEAFASAGAWLGRAIAMVANVLDPDIVTVGGGVIAAAERTDGTPGNWYVDTAAAVARLYALPRIAERLEVRTASLLNDAALIGVAALADEER